ncbi:hypothetical protein C8F01DRAFT_1125275 [Mycena amicta]|nr:hypothetical protein C8F01DRAFT_1125275 [Mycena amicta]
MNRPSRPGTSRPVAVPSTRTQVFHGNEASSGQWQRSKSRSPSRHGAGTRTDPFILAGAPAVSSIKRKRSVNSIGNSSGPIVIDDVDRGQRIKSKPASSSLFQNRPTASGSSSRPPRRERDFLRTAPDNLIGNVQPLPLGNLPIRRTVDMPPPPALAAEYERMRKELETLKKTVHDSKKHTKKQNKTIEELRAQLAAEKLTREQQEKTLATVSTKLSRNEQLVQSIESSLQCQICIEIVSKPHLIVPCGHIFCLGCLQQWFRAAPAEDEDAMNFEDHLLHREKKCPMCRTRVVRRPVPVFVVKDVANALHPPAPSSVVDDDSADPWKGLFLEDYDSDGSGDEDDDDVEDYEYSDGGSGSEGDGADVFHDYFHGDELAALMFGAHPFTRFYETPSDSDGEEEEVGMAQVESGSGSGSGSGEDDDDEGFSDEGEYYAAPAGPLHDHDDNIWHYHPRAPGTFEDEFNAWLHGPHGHEDPALEQDEVDEVEMQVFGNVANHRQRRR